MKMLPILACALLMNSFAYADLVDSCSITDRTSCVLNNANSWSQFLVTLPNYTYCGVKFLSDTYPKEQVLTDFADGLYVTAGPRWDLTTEQGWGFDVNLVYAVGNEALFATWFNVYTRDGQSLNDYVHQKLATSYQPNPTVTLTAANCN